MGGGRGAPGWGEAADGAAAAPAVAAVDGAREAGR